MKTVFVCSPLRGDYENNIEKANGYCKMLAAQGVVPLAPHTIFTQYLNDAIPEERELGMAMGKEILSRCDEVLVFGDEITEGMLAELEEANDLGITIYSAILKDNEMIGKVEWEPHQPWQSMQM